MSELEKPMTPESIVLIERLLREVSTIVKRKGREILTKFPITQPQFSALIWLYEEGDLTIGELSQKMFLACSTMTDLVDRMEKNELVARVRDERDRRVVRIHILSKGKEIIDKVLETRRAYLTKMIGQISEAEAIQITKMLTQLHQQMNKS